MDYDKLKLPVMSPTAIEYPSTWKSIADIGADKLSSLILFFWDISKNFKDASIPADTSSILLILLNENEVHIDLWALENYIASYCLLISHTRTSPLLFPSPK